MRQTTRRLRVRLFRKAQNPLFIEEEIYQWADERSHGRGPLLVLGVAFIAAGLLFGTLN